MKAKVNLVKSYSVLKSLRKGVAITPDLSRGFVQLLYFGFSPDKVLIS